MSEAAPLILGQIWPCGSKIAVKIKKIENPLLDLQSWTTQGIVPFTAQPCVEYRHEPVSFWKTM